MTSNPFDPATTSPRPPAIAPVAPDTLAGLDRGDPAAVAAFVRERAASLLRIARAIVADERAAQEAVGAALTTALRSLDRFRTSEALGAWLEVAVARACVESRRSRDPVTRPAAIEPLLPRFLPDGHREAAGAAMRADVVPDRERLRTCIDALPGRHGEAMLLCDVVGLAFDRAAEVLGVGRATLRRLRQRARQALCTLLSDAAGRAAPVAVR